MAPRKFLKIEAGDLEMLSEHLSVYATKCQLAAQQLRSSDREYVLTDGFKSTLDGLQRLRKLIKEFVGEVGLPDEHALKSLLNKRLKEAGYETAASRTRSLKVAETKKTSKRDRKGAE